MFWKTAALCLAGAAACLSPAVAQMRDNTEKKLSCTDRAMTSKPRVCDLREQTMAPSGALAIDASPNGGITAKGWSSSQILVRARVEAWGDTEAEAAATMNQVRVITGAAKIYAEGPDKNRNPRWSVTYEVFLPHASDLTLETINGGIEMTDLRGTLSFETVNGSATLARLAGRLKGETVNGGVRAELSGKTWDGESFELETVNGGINVSVAQNFNAVIDASSVNGGLKCELPIKIDSASRHKMQGTVGSGGPRLKLSTVNGGLTLRSSSI